jgi:tRNA dimethylallyltransferase
LAADERVARAVALLRDRPDRLLAVVGPTATGKTELAVGVAEQVAGEIVSADSVQVYRGFDVGSGKPTAEERARAPHHLVSILDPGDPIEAASYAKLAERAIAEVRSRGKVPILCGGTFFWVRALVLGLVDAPAGDPDIRARHRALVDERGRGALHAELQRLDPASASRLHPNDVVRVSRALEVFELSGRTMSEWQASHGFKERKLETQMVGLAVDPAELTRRITTRVDRWLDQGWIAEVEQLIAKGHGEARAMGSVGYAEVRDHVEGRLPKEKLRDTIVQSTRIFARRQRTWLKSADVTWL